MTYTLFRKCFCVLFVAVVLLPGHNAFAGRPDSTGRRSARPDGPQCAAGAGQRFPAFALLLSDDYYLYPAVTIGHNR